MAARKRPSPEPVHLSRDEARAYLVGQHGLNRFRPPEGAAGVRALLHELRCIQLDPLDPWGTNADLIAFARVEGLRRGDVYGHVYPGHAFEHFAKQRCLLPARAFPWYREQATAVSWWRMSERLQRLPPSVITEVLAEVRERGPVAGEALADRGKVKPLSWDGWNSTGRASSMALEVLWTRCQVVVCGRTSRGKIYDLPERALPGLAPKPAGDFARWALLERVEAAGLLSRPAAALWSRLPGASAGPLARQLVEEGLLEQVLVEGETRPYLAPGGFRSRAFGKPDERLRILAPLDSLLWDRNLVQNVFGFEYIWEVYKPAALRRWGWYVCPLLHRGRLVGRIEGAVDGDTLRVKKIWRERAAVLDEAALTAALDGHARACGVDQIVRPRRVLLS